MKRIELLLGALLIVAAAVAVARASDSIAVYARVDKVVLEPGAGAPNAIQIWGVFSMAKPNEPNAYLPPVRGYLYFETAGNKEVARKEWADLNEIAGSGQIVSFGSRYQLRARMRKANERPERPDRYAVSIGMTKVRGNTDYTPVRGLIDFKD